MTPDDDLRAQRDTLLQQLRDLEDEHAAGDLADADYQSLKDDYTARAAATIRRLDAAIAGPLPGAIPRPDDGSRPEAGRSAAGGSEPISGANALPGDQSRRKAGSGAGGGGSAASGSDPLSGANALPGDQSRRKAGSEAGGGRRGRRLRTAAIVGLLAIVSGGIGYAVAQSSGERLEGDEASGDIPENGVDRITKAQVLASEGKVLDAVKEYDEVLDDDPENPVALAQRGFLISRVDTRLVDDGLAQVEHAIELDPTYADAHFFHGVILLRGKDDPTAAAAAFQRGIDARPDPQLLATLQEYKAMAEEAAASATP